ncbi:hypothetical protein WG908_15205 [Sphingobium sp. AN641]|uniref:hypothetical protein n=1 Tax=Sphingobium sp. AN641 TaxID=3133443 RepID=UPI0030BE2D76
MFEIDLLLSEAASALVMASDACREWEMGGDSQAVGDTAVSAYEASLTAVRQLEIEGALPATVDVGASRRARLTSAAHMLCLAGIDEGGISEDLELAASLFRLAAHA